MGAARPGAHASRRTIIRISDGERSAAATARQTCCRVPISRRYLVSQSRAHRGCQHCAARAARGTTALAASSAHAMPSPVNGSM